MMRIVLADGQAKVRSALRLLLEQEPGLSIAGEASEAEGLLAAMQTNCPDLVLVDWNLPGAASPQKLIASLLARCPGLYIVVLSGRPEASQIALEAGANAFVSKGDPPEKLLAALRLADARENQALHAKEGPHQNPPQTH